ncbi:sugar transferase [uncultured Christiangramia sp.]|uniref:sugar transferase n=1 Tax=Christiangramia sp. 3-2217-3z TaxID=3417564 RepID=UPI00261CF078|nr:sugar transferase [uncultured Christiangramia sp.]
MVTTEFLQGQNISKEDFIKVKIGTTAYKKVVADSLNEDACQVTSSLCHTSVLGLEEDLEKIINLERLNDIRYLNKFLEAVNSRLSICGEFIGRFEEYNSRKRRIIHPQRKPFNYVVHSGDILLNRVTPKFPIAKKIYFGITKGKGRVLSKAEAFGRLYSCGFEITEENDIEGETYFTARKIKEPVYDKYPSYGPLIKLRRVGKDGNLIKVYKLRTMHPFSEYLQDYIFRKNELQEGGKFKDDFRISKEGKIFRKFWIDELPMFINFFKGEMKLIGVRPLSQQYFNLYTKELQEKRTRTKPGLLPPFYADMPKTLEEIIASEMKYLEAYEKAPITTDFKYFFLAFKSIFFKGARSK